EPRVPQELLDQTEVGPGVQEVRRKGMAKRVGRHPAGESRGACARPDDPVEAPHGEAPAPRVPEERAPRVGARPEVQLERLDGLSPERDDALLPPLAENPYAALAEVHVLDVQPGQLRDAHAGGVQHLQDGPVAAIGFLLPERLTEERLALIDREVRRQPAGQTGRLHLAGGVHTGTAAPDQKAEEAAERGETTGDRRPGEPASVEVSKVSAYHAGVGVREGAERATSEEADAVEEIGAVAADGVRGRPSLGRKVPEKRRDRRAALLAARRLHALSSSRR